MLGNTSPIRSDLRPPLWESSSVSTIGPGTPSTLRQFLVTRLQPGERARLWVDFDLDEQQRFAAQLIVLTDSRLIAATSLTECEDFSLERLRQVVAREVGAIGKFELQLEIGRAHV